MKCFVHLFTHKEGQMTLMTIGYKTIDNFNESCILQNGFSKVSNHIFSIVVYSLNQVVYFYLFFTIP